MTIDHNIIPTAPRKAYGSLLAFSVGFYFAFRATISVLLIRYLGVDPQAAAATGLLLDFLLLAFVCLSMLGHSGRGSGVMLKLASLRWVFLFLGLSGCSLFWTASISPVASAAYWCGTASDVGIVILLLRCSSAYKAADSLMEGFIWGACVVAIVAWLMPAQYDLRLGDEDYLNANTIANLCAFAVFFAQYMTRSGNGLWRLIISFLAITLLRSLSKTTIVAFVISEAFLIIQDRAMSRRAKLYLTLSVVVVVLAFWGLFEAYYDFYTTYGNQAETLTGRTAIWAYVTDAVLQKPWIGYGFDSMWKVTPVFGTFEARHAENEVLEQLYSYGVLGLVVLCGLYGALYQKLRTWSEAPLRLVCFAMLIFVLVRGLAVADPFDVTFRLWTIILLTFLATRNEPRRIDLPHSAHAADNEGLILGDGHVARA